MTGQLRDKIALVTGGASGIGRTTALAFAREGAKVVVADIREEKGEETVQMINKAGGQAFFVKTDVSKMTDVSGLVQQTIEIYGYLDYAFNNAGIGAKRIEKSAEQSEKDFERIIEVNLKGVWLCMKYEILQMLKQGVGVIVNNSSVAGLRSNTIDTTAYIASKHGVNGLTTMAALQYAEKNIRVNAICPGCVLTPLAEKAIRKNPQIEDWMKGEVPMQRWGTPEEIAETVLWLCSEDASYVTGQTIVMDGGMLVG